MNMHMTVEEVLKLKNFKNAKLIAGKNGVHKEIHHINAMEVPDITPWLTEGELLITTGYSIRNNKNELKNIINCLSKSDSAGLAIKTKFIGPIDDELLELANRLNVPIILLPDDIPFVELTTPIIKSLANKQKELRIYYKKIHDLFIQLELNGEGLNGIAKMINSLIGRPVLIIDSNYTPLSQCDFIINSGFKNNLVQFLNNKVDNLDNLVEEICVDNEEFLIRKVLLKNKVCAFIIIDVTNCNKNIQKVILDHASTVIALEKSKKEAILKYNLALDNMFFVDIMSDNIKSEENLILRAESLNWPKPPYIPIYFDIKNFSKHSIEYTEQELHELKLGVLKIIETNISSLSINQKTFLKSDNYSCLIPITDNKLIVNNLDRTISKILFQVKKQFNLILFAGVGKHIVTLSDLKSGFESAKLALDITRKLNIETHFSYFENLKLEVAVLNSNSIDYFKDYVLQTLENIYIFDLKNNSNLLETLYIYVFEGCNSTVAANKLYIHRNTMNYRLNQLKNNLCIDINNPNIIVNLTIAYKLNDILKIYKI